jgi:hypothetical protein
MSIRKAAIVLALACVAALAAPMAASAHTSATTRSLIATTTQATSFRNIPVSGRALNGTAFKGHFTVSQFVTRNGKTFALGTLNGKLGWRTVHHKQVAFPATLPTGSPAGAAATCPVLNLTLGPLSLNLLGLHVNLNQVVLNITAQSGPGNLLGNLLCSVAGLLNQGSVLSSDISGLLNIVQQLLGNAALMNL